MAIIKYPDWLPLAQRASKNLTQQTPFRSDQPAVGAPIFQKLTTDIAATWSLTWVFTLAEERAFVQWLRSSRYLNKCNNWFTMMIDLGGSGLQEQTLHFTDYPVQTSIDGGVVTWTGNVIAKKLNNTMDEFDDVLVELDYRWFGWLDEVVNRDLPQVYMTPILHMPINLLASTLDSRIVYEGPQVYYINRNGNLVQSAANQWPLTFIDGVAVGRVPPEGASRNLYINSETWATGIQTSVRNNAEVSPRGDITMAEVTATTSNSEHYANDRSIGVQQYELYSYSIFVKPTNDPLNLQLRVASGTTAFTIFNPVTGAFLQNTGVNFVSKNAVRVSEDTYRVTMVFRAGATRNSVIRVQLASGVSTIFAGTGENGIYVWGAQLEKSANTTSYIQTSAIAGDRASASAKVSTNGATSIDITYSDGSVVNVPSVDGYATIPQADSAWGSKYITTIKFNV